MKRTQFPDANASSEIDNVLAFFLQKHTDKLQAICTYFIVVGIEPRSLYRLCKHFATELLPQHSHFVLGYLYSSHGFES